MLALALTQGQVTFAISFIIVFAIGIVWAYRFDAKRQKKYFKGTLTIVFILILIWVSLFALVHFMH